MSELKRLTRSARIGAGSAGVLSLLMSATTVYAADTETIAEIVVTAQKRAENLQEVPTSVSVFGEAQLTRLHATQLNDFAAYLPGVSITSGGGPGQTTITLRGIAPVGPAAVVGTYIDETPLGASSHYARATEFGLDLMPYDVERVEVLRGPQGTLYGAGSMGGLLKYVMRDPSTEGFEFRAGVEGFDVTGADDMGWGARAGVNAPLGETAAFRASGYMQNTPGYVDNPSTGEENENELEQTGGRAAFLWRVSETLSVELGGTWQRIDSDDNGTMRLSLLGVDPIRAESDIGDLKNAHPLQQRFQKDLDYYSATVDWNLGWGQFVSASSYSTMHTLQQTDATEIFGTLYPLLTGGAIPAGLADFTVTLDLDKWTQEFRLASSAANAIEWRIGAFYTEEESDNLQLVTPMDMQGQVIPAFAPYLAIAQLPTDYSELAVFGDVTFKFSDSFDLIAGLRWAANDQQFRQISGGAILPVTDTPGESEEEVLTYMLSPRWRVSDDTMAYLRVASGYRPGGPNAVVLNLPPTVDSDELVNYEAGLKTQFNDGRALFNAAVFFIDWSDIQQVRTFGGVGGLGNAGDAESMGVEVESLFSVGTGLRLGLNLAYTDSTLVSNPEPLDNRVGVQLPNVPKWSGAVTADYDFTMLGGREAHIGAGWRYVDEQQSQVVTNTDSLSYLRPDYDVLDLNADVTFDAVTLRLFVKNLTDERAYTGGGTIVNGLNIPVRVDVNVLQPRTVGLSLDVQF